MSGGEEGDKIIREREFKRLSDIEIDIQIKEKEEGFEQDEEGDEAFGEIFDPFVDSGSSSPGTIREDGSVLSAPERDIVSELSLEGERKVNWILMGSMIVLYSAISIQVGRTFEPLSGALVLVFLSIMGFYFGEIWIPKKKMALLGVTWVIISMKVLYGLAIELRYWGVISDDLGLGILLLFLVALNIFVAYRHDHDAIAAQSTLVLLAIGSTAGTEFGESGVAVMILLATILLHGIAIQRNSGNLASLGIASSNLWIGMHAVTSEFKIGPLIVMPIETPLLLFLLLMSVTVANAVMATKFARKGNWFSKAFEAVGLGKPGLWGVSISLGMIGASLAVASNRQDLGYALGMVTFLGGSFGGSYLVVRGVEPRRVIAPLLSVGSILTLILLGQEAVEGLVGLTSYQIFTILGASTTVGVILRDQNSVTDRVLWIGSVAILFMLVILIPAESKSSGGDGGFLLLGLLSILHLGTAILAVIRSSPSLSGVTVLLPWFWVLMEQILEEIIRTVMLANDISDSNGIIELDPTPLAIYLALSGVLLFSVNIRLGGENVNLASGFLGISEISASIRDSGILNLWSIGLWLPMLTILFLAQFGGFTSVSMVVLLGLISSLHVVGHVLGFRIGSEEALAWILAISCLVVQWRHGLDEAMLTLLCISISTILYFGNGKLFGLGFGLVSMPILISISGKEASLELISPEWYSGWSESFSYPEIELLAVLCTAAMLVIYLPRAEKMEEILKPASSALLLLVVNGYLSISSGEAILGASSLLMFAGASFWLISRGEIRSELRSAAKRDSIIGMFSVQDSYSGDLADRPQETLNGGKLNTYNPKIAELAELRKRKREMAESEEISELMTSDLSHTPSLGLVIIGIVLVLTVICSAMGFGPLVMISSGIFCCVIVVLIRRRTRGLELELPHFLGMETPIALAIFGICLSLVSAHVIPVDSSPRELLDLAVSSVLVLVLVTISLIHQKNLLERITIAIDWFIFPLLAARLIAAVMVGGLPFPLLVDPLDGDSLNWKGPWLLLELMLILCVMLGVWVERKRAQTGRRMKGDGTAIGVRCIAIVLLSFGPAGLLAAASASYRSVENSEASGLGIALPGAVLAYFSLAGWNEVLMGFFGELLLFLGLLLIFSCALTVPMSQERWTMTLAVDGHIFTLTGALYLGMIGGLDLPLLLVVMSTVIWVVGILQLRKALRIWGLADLVAAVLFSIVFASSEIVKQDKLFLGMIVLALELGIIAWLGLANQEDLAKD